MEDSIVTGIVHTIIPESARGVCLIKTNFWKDLNLNVTGDATVNVTSPCLLDNKSHQT